jgi:hypothetical protein
MHLVQDRFLIKSAISLICILFLTSTYAEEINKAAPEASSAKIFDMFDENEDLQTSDDTQNIKISPDSDESETPDIAQGTEQPKIITDDLSTSEKLEALKLEVIAVNRDLFILEEDLLFPASTQVALYFSVDIGYFFALDNLKLKIDDKQVTHHLYTEKDVDALYRGAIQKAYIGNVNSGEHELVALIVGTGPHNRAYRKAISFTFEKATGAKAIEIQLRDDSGKMQPTLNVVEW